MKRNCNLNSSEMTILHVLTLDGNSGIYGGPSQVAQNLSRALNKKSYQTKILSGSINQENTENLKDNDFERVKVKSLVKSQPITSLFSFGILISLIRNIRNRDVIHIHFGRELIPLTAAVICIILRKKFILQTHGMIKPDKRYSIRILDYFLIRHLIRMAYRVLALTPDESNSISKFSGSNIELLPNGINFDSVKDVSVIKSQRVIFCSRINKRKRPEFFVDAAIELQEEFPGIKFEIYGPNGGWLDQLEKHLKNRNFNLSDFYFGPLSHSEVQKKIAESLVTVLPSFGEPFPMVILESLAVGTPVLVMPSCQISEIIHKIDQNFVAAEESVKGVVETLRLQLIKLIKDPNHFETKNKSIPFFSEDIVTNKLISIYKSLESEIC